MNTIIIIQARMGSTRLPGKILKPLGDLTVLEYVVNACQKSKKATKVIVATSDLERDDQVEGFLEERNIECFRGSESNVLSRYYFCAKEYKADLIVRVTADCPFLDPTVIDMLIEKSIDGKYDRVATIDNNNPRTFPYGIDAEVVTFKAIEKAFKEAKTDFDKEHVTPYIHTTKKDDFSLYRLDAPKDIREPNIRVTLDTPEDYELCVELVKFLPKDYTTKDIIKIYRNNPYLYNIN
jgi:spore coat polysaccharide biosynthesis protein SpsF